MSAKCAPGLGASSGLKAEQWRFSQSYRFFQSDRHFTGAREDVHRTEEGSEVINTIFTVDSSLTYGLTDRISLQLTVPYQIAERSSPLRNAEQAVIDRSIVRARGFGDMAFSARTWLLDPVMRPRFNMEVGLGVKLPSGNCSIQDTRKRFDTATQTKVAEVTTVDQSIQPGDCGWGVPFNLTAVASLTQELSLFVDGTYLLNPRETNGVLTYRRRSSEGEMSVADQYLLRIGGSYQLPWVGGLGVSLGGRIDGVPVRDLIGGSNGFRRPGFTLSIDPGVSFRKDAWLLFLNVPVALHRERQRSVTDMMDGTHGDAAFADYQVAAGFARTF